jgi:hypothetical protein
MVSLFVAELGSYLQSRSFEQQLSIIAEQCDTDLRFELIDRREARNRKRSLSLSLAAKALVCKRDESKLFRSISLVIGRIAAPDPGGSKFENWFQRIRRSQKIKNSINAQVNHNL